MWQKNSPLASATLDVVLAPCAHVSRGNLAIRFEPADDRPQVEFVVQEPDLGVPAVRQGDGRSQRVNCRERLEDGEQPEIGGLSDESPGTIGQPGEAADKTAAGIVDFHDQGV